MKKTTMIFGAAALVLVLAVSQSVFTVDQTETAILLQLGKPVDGPLGPGLHFKLPFVQNVIFFDSRLLDYDAKAAEVLTKDKKNMVVDNYSKWRIVDPLQFYRTLRTQHQAQARLDDIIYAELRVVIGKYTLIELVSTKRPEIMTQVTEKSNAMLAPYGIQVVDVRIKRTDLPPENQQAIFGRMRAERIRQAKLYRSEGQEEMEKIKSGADRQRVVIIAEAQRKAEVLRGQGDAEATALYAQSLSKSPEFYAFMRSLEAYKRGLADNARMIMTPSSEFLKYLR